MFNKDLIFLHPPSVFDFRKKSIMFGPISDVVPSSPAFEMYPVGITSIADILEQNGFNVQIVNLAYQMVRDPAYEPAAIIAKLKSKMFAIDLHWMPHAHGCIEIAKLLKKYHPHIPILVGGLSASYFHEELIQNPLLDFIIRGDSTENAVLQLIRAWQKGLPLDNIPNLTWKKANGQVVVNHLTDIPENIDYTSIPSYKYVVKSVFKYRSLHNAVPYSEWLKYPVTALLTSRGCTQNCAICGGSSSSYQKICSRSKPAYRSPKTLIEDILLLQSFSPAPIFVLNDFRMSGPKTSEEFLYLLEKSSIKNELVFELFFPAGDELFSRLGSCPSGYSIQITLETHLERIRKINGKLPVSNEKIEQTIESALNNGCRKIDLFFMIGLPKQTYDDAVSAVTYCRYLLEKFQGDTRLNFFAAPLAPFLDPGSPAFENPEQYGYKLFYRSFEEHRQALTKPSWKYILNYETDSMTRDEIVEATYECALRLSRLKCEYKIISERDLQEIEFRIKHARSVIGQIDYIMTLPEEQQRIPLQIIKNRVAGVNSATICGKDELKWPLRKKAYFSMTKALLKLFFFKLSLLFNAN